MPRVYENNRTEHKPNIRGLFHVKTGRFRVKVTTNKRKVTEMNNYIHKCELCGKEFDLYNGEGWGESYFKDEAMLPSTRYVCMDCIHERKEKNERD